MNKKIIIVLISGILFIISSFFVYSKYISSDFSKVKLIRDWDVFADVRFSWDKSKCDILIDEQIKAKCVSVATSVPIYKEVMTLWDSTKCNTIDNIEVKNRCLDLAKGRDIRSEAILKWDVNLCNKLSWFNNQMCKMKVNEFLKAVESKNTENCSTFLIDAISDECKKRISWQK